MISRMRERINEFVAFATRDESQALLSSGSCKDKLSEETMHSFGSFRFHAKRLELVEFSA